MTSPKSSGTETTTLASSRRRNKRLMRFVSGAGLLFLIGGVIAGALRPDPRAQGESSPAGNALGQQIYVNECSECHGADLAGEENWQIPNIDGTLRAPPHDETGHSWHHDDAYLLEAVRLGGGRLSPNVGVSEMPAYGDTLSDDEIAAVLAYIKSTWPADIREMQESR